MIHGQIKPLFNTPINWGHPLAQGLCASYLMNEGCGDLVHDSCGMNDGKMIGMAPMSPTSGWVPGPHGAALALPGASAYVEIPDNDIVSLTGSFTIIASIIRNALGIQHSVVEKYNDSSKNGYALRITSANKVLVAVLDVAGAMSNLSTGTIPIGVLKTIAYVFSKEKSTDTIFIDGLQDAPDMSQTKIPTNGTSSLKIGARGNDALTPFNGLISSVSIYNRALSAEEIAYLYAFPWCIYEAGQGAWAQKDYGREARLANYYQQMRAA